MYIFKGGVFIFNLFSVVGDFLVNYSFIWLLLFFILLLSFIMLLFKFLNVSELDFEEILAIYFGRRRSLKMRRQRRAARRRLMRYRRDCRRRAKYDVFSRKENSYFVEFMRKE